MEKNMNAQEKKDQLEAEKIELIKLRIQNKYYDREDVLIKTIQEIFDSELNPKN